MIQRQYLDGLREPFDKLLTKTHVAYALVQPSDKHNDIPFALSTILLLQGTEAQLEAVYEAKSQGLEKWPISPARVYHSSRAAFFGDKRYQRAYMDFFSHDLLQQSGRANAMAMQHLLTEPEPLIYGLFGNFGQPLVSLSDAYEVRSPIMVVQALTLACVHFDMSLRDLLLEVQAAETPSSAVHHQSPYSILQAIGHDGRFSNVVQRPGYTAGLRQVLTNQHIREALVHYIRLIDVTDPRAALERLAETSIWLLTATHKKGKPAFDYYLAMLATFVNSARILLGEFADPDHVRLLVRGVWMMFVLAYITQMRPVIDRSVQLTGDLPKEQLHADWDAVSAEFRGDSLVPGSKYLDCWFLRTLRSAHELKIHGLCSGGTMAAYKLRWQWRRWTGLGADVGQDHGLNIRL